MKGVGDGQVDVDDVESVLLEQSASSDRCERGNVRARDFEGQCRLKVGSCGQ